MKNVYYFAAWTNSDCLEGCDHQHQTVTSATACSFGACGGYVVAVETQIRKLTEEEEAEFQFVKYRIGTRPDERNTLKKALGYLPETGLC